MALKLIDVSKPLEAYDEVLANAKNQGREPNTADRMLAMRAAILAYEADKANVTPPTRGTDSQRNAGSAVGVDGTVYHNVAEIYHQAEECEALHMWLDSKGVPRADAEGRVFSPVGRVMGMAQDAARFRWLNEDHADADVRWAAHMLAKRLGTSSYFAITRDIDAEMGAGSAREGGDTKDPGT